MSAKKRVYLRKQASFRVDIRRKDGHEINDASSAKLSDVAGGGVCFTSKTPFSFEEELYLTMHLPAGSVDAQASVVRCESSLPGEYNIAVKFVDMSDENILLLYTPI
jgi:hypothetical protein